MTKECTWENCLQNATVPQIASDGEEWANLCNFHDDIMGSHMIDFDVKQVLSDWVKAQGGSEISARRMVDARVDQRFPY